MKNFLVVAIVVLVSTGCGTTNNLLARKTKNIEYYRIFDIKTSASRQVISNAASDGLGRNINTAQETTPIPSSGEIPEKAGRFKLVEPLKGSSIAALAGGASGIGMRLATCEGAAWTAEAIREIENSNRLRLTACLFQYKDGYHLDLYAMFTKKEGGVFQISRSMAQALVGSPEEWTEKTFLDIVRSIKLKTDAEITLLEAQPELSGTPWLDNLDGW